MWLIRLLIKSIWDIGIITAIVAVAVIIVPMAGVTLIGAVIMLLAREVGVNFARRMVEYTSRLGAKIEAVFTRCLRETTREHVK